MLFLVSLHHLQESCTLLFHHCLIEFHTALSITNKIADHKISKDIGDLNGTKQTQPPKSLHTGRGFYFHVIRSLGVGLSSPQWGPGMCFGSKAGNVSVTSPVPSMLFQREY